ncbi:MAG: hypothetical protein VE99_C0006G0013 [candidate division Kazan bacterium GW2011_GWC1_52_13]|nr:MAG: hypothetical protein VE99_C0006G0013 [candidate division Kazan bacterium GW2011_GWC1_52_13]
MNNNLPKFIPVNEVERLAGVSYNTLRYYTKIGLLPHMIRKTPFPGAPNTIGHYPEEVLETLQKINELKKQGLDNEKIKKTLEKPVLEERPMSKPVEKPVEPVLPPPVPAPILPPTPPPPPVNLVPLMAEEHKQSNLLEQISHFLTNMIQKPLPAAEPARAKVFTNLLTLFLVFAALAILSLGFSDLAHERIKRLFGGFWDQYLERILPGNVLGIKQILNPIVDVNDVLEYRYIKGTRWLAAKLPFLADTGRFLGKVFFGKGDNYFISPLGDAYLRNIYAQNITASSITSKTSSFDTAEITNLNVQNLTVSGTTVGGGGGGGGPAQGGDADTLEGQTGSYYLDLDNEIGTCSNCLTTTEIDESTLIVFNAENASTLDGLDSSQFLRSDTSDNYTSGTLTFDPGTTLDLQGIVLNSAGTLTLSDNVSVTGDLGVLGDLTVSGATFSDGDVFLGDTAADTITFIGVVSSDILPSASNTWDLGSTALRWGTGYFDNVDANSISGSLAASGTNSASWTINQDNLTANGETAALAFETGTGVFNAVLQWNASGDPGRFAGYDDQFVFNYPISLFSQVSGPNVSFSSGSLINYGQSATHAYTQTGALTGVDLDFSSNITVPDSSSGNQTGILVTLKDGGGSATSIGLQTAGTLDYGLEIGGTIGTADIRLSNGALLTNTAGTLTVAEDLLRVGTGSPNAIDSLGGDLYVTSDLEVDGVIYGNGGGLTNITADFASDSNLLDGFDSSQFLRSDTNDNFESGTLTTDAGTTLDINGNLAWGGATITEALDMATNIITDIGNAGTDFDTGGGLTLAGDLTVTGGEVFLTPIASSGSTTEGTIYYDSDNDKLYVYSNGAFRALTTTTRTIWEMGPMELPPLIPGRLLT